MKIGSKYELVRVLGRGATGEVHEAVERETDRRAAVKIMAPPRDGASEAEVEARADAESRFAREARAVAAIRSRHIVELFEAGVDDDSGFPYVATEYLEGEDAGTMVRRLGPLEPMSAVKIGIHAAAGLARAHELGILHRDVRPASLFIARTDLGPVVKILDFGVSRFVGPEASPEFMAPEQVRGQKRLDARIDVWGLGATLYMLLTGRPPHTLADAGSPGELVIAICFRRAPDLRTLAPWVPEEVAAIVHKALSIEAQERYAHAGEMLTELRAIAPSLRDLTSEALIAVTPLTKNALPKAASAPDPERGPPSSKAPSSRTPSVKVPARVVKARPSGWVRSTMLAVVLVALAVIGAGLATPPPGAGAHRRAPSAGVQP